MADSRSIYADDDAAVSDRGMLDIGPGITPRNIPASHVLTCVDASYTAYTIHILHAHAHTDMSKNA
jgi:hypothetical protein